MNSLRLTTVVFSGLFLSFASALSAAEPLEGFDSFVEQAVRDYGVPGASVAVVKDGKVIFLKGYGVRQAGKPEPVDEHTLFMAASVTKTFTAGLAGMMVDEGKIGWDTPVIDRYPEVILFDEYATRHVTLRDFLAHRSGLPAFSGDFLEKLGYPRTDVLHRLRHLKPACSFREWAGYSNPGFFLAGMTTAKVGGKSWDELIQQRIFEPLKMTDSKTSTSSWKTSKNYAAAHMVAGDGFEMVTWEDHDVMGPAGSIVTSAADLAQWVRLQLSDGTVDGKQLLSKEALKVMHTPAMVEKPSFAEAPPISETCGFSYGLGWNVYQFGGHEIIEKGGARAGMRAVITLIPEKGIGVAVLSNRNVTMLPEAIRAWILEKSIGPAPGNLQKEIREAGTKIDKMFLQKPEIPKATHAASLPMKAFAGEYENELYGRIAVNFADEKLSWAAGPAKFGAGIAHVGYDNFLLLYPPGHIVFPEPVTFLVNADGVPDRLITEALGTFTRVVEPAR